MNKANNEMRARTTVEPLVATMLLLNLGKKSIQQAEAGGLGWRFYPNSSWAGII
jgi:hypothetical protein